MVYLVVTEIMYQGLVQVTILYRMNFNLVLCFTADILQELNHHHEMYKKEVEGPGKKRAFNALQRGLIRCQEIGDDKIQLLAVVIDHIENRTRQLDQDLENLGWYKFSNLMTRVRKKHLLAGDF